MFTLDKVLPALAMAGALSMSTLKKSPEQAADDTRASVEAVCGDLNKKSTAPQFTSFATPEGTFEGLDGMPVKTNADSTCAAGIDGKTSYVKMPSKSGKIVEYVATTGDEGCGDGMVAANADGQYFDMNCGVAEVDMVNPDRAAIEASERCVELCKSVRNTADKLLNSGPVASK
ncbi:hypothetical protein IPJ72_04875 [Candidatus Peregrinibacteria bacterium]|nr:MAG: hypothetical protein IPJ72_04875 [Candidatus Peregrinibacteria bacterium]